MLKPLKDLIRRRGGEQIHFWELQERGAWHVMVLTDERLEVKELRPWMMKRNWGPQMFVKEIKAPRCYNDGVTGWHEDTREVMRLIKYVLKYVTKEVDFGDGAKSKNFGGTHASKVGTVKFAWSPDVAAGAYLWFYGRATFVEIEGRQPTWREMAYVIRLGVEATDWLSVDPWWMPSGP